jgi:hypothetical protein
MNECILRISRSLALRAAHRHNIGPRERHGSEGTVVDEGRRRGKDVAARGRRRPRSGGSKRKRRHGVEPQGLCKARVDVFDIPAGGELESHAVDGGVAASQQEEKRNSISGSSRRGCGGRGIVVLKKRRKRVEKHKIKSCHDFVPNSQNLSRKF